MSLTLSEIVIYPTKSLRGVAVAEAVVEPRGLRGDRRWMVVDATELFVTQRALPRMALVEALLCEQGGLDLAAPGMSPLHVAETAAGRVRQVTIWRDTVAAHDGGDEAAAWLTAFLGRPCRLVQMPMSTERAVSPAYGQPGDIVSFADGYPFLLIGQASLDDLNTRLASPLPMRRFRPNLVIAGAEPFAEDRWTRICIDDIVFRVVKPCARCTIPTVDPDAGEFAGKEPLRTLATFRKVGSKVLFGQNVIAEGVGMLHIGAQVKILG